MRHFSWAVLVHKQMQTEKKEAGSVREGGGLIWLWLQKPQPKWNPVGGNMAQNLHNPSRLVLSHTHLGHPDVGRLTRGQSKREASEYCRLDFHRLRGQLPVGGGKATRQHWPSVLWPVGVASRSCCIQSERVS